MTDLDRLCDALAACRREGARIELPERLYRRVCVEAERLGSVPYEHRHGLAGVTWRPTHLMGVPVDVVPDDE